MKRTALLLLACLALPAGALEPVNIDIGTPPVIVIRHSMTQRQSRLERFQDAGIIGLGKDGMLYTRQREGGKKLTLMQRQIAEKLIDAENNDRKALVYAIAHDHEGKLARVDEIRALLLKRWQEKFKSGWWLQDEQGNWVQKP